MRFNQSIADLRWGLDDPIEVIDQLCLNAKPIYEYIDVVSQFGSCHRPYPLEPADLPDLVTFTDVNSPKSVMLVDPNDLGTTLGPGVSWRSMTLEVTDEPLIKGIDKRLPWVNDPKIHLRFEGLKARTGLPLEIYPNSFKSGAN